MLKHGNYFSEQAREEKVVLFLRRHWFSFCYWIIIILILFLGPLLLYLFLGNVFSNLISLQMGSAYLIVGLACYYLFILALFLTAWMNYYLNVIIITKARLVDIKQIGLFNRKVSEQSLLRVQDVSSRMTGFFQTLLLFGTVYVETAGESPNFTMPNVPKPYKVSNTIMKLHEDLIRLGADRLGMAEGEGVIKVGKITKPEQQIGVFGEPGETDELLKMENPEEKIHQPVSEAELTPGFHTPDIVPSVFSESKKETVLDKKSASNFHSSWDSVETKERGDEKLPQKTRKSAKSKDNSEGELKEGETIEL